MCGERWSSRASLRFAALVSGCVLLVKVFSVVHSVLHVDVYRYSGVQDLVHVRDVLIAEGYAELAEESYESKVHTQSLSWGLGALCLRVSEGRGLRVNSWREFGVRMLIGGWYGFKCPLGSSRLNLC